jgi:hypothetical protein
LDDLAKAQLKQKWRTLQRVLSSQSRLEQIVDDEAKTDRILELVKKQNEY